jgi:hypothetical protein
MDNDERTPAPGATAPEQIDLARIIQDAVQSAYSQRDPETAGLRSELVQERRKREQLEKRLNELVEENQRSKALAEQTERYAAIRSELQQLGVGKVELAFRAVKEEVVRGEDNRLYARAEDGSLVALRDHLSQWVTANPEFKPARISGGAGSSASRSGPSGSHFDLERIRPGMSAEEMERARAEIARVAAQALAGPL